MTDTKVGVYEMIDGKALFVNSVTLVYVGNNFKGWTSLQVTPINLSRIFLRI